MKSNLSKILPKLQEKFPNVDISFLIQHYFDVAKQEVEDFTRPEIAFPWGTLRTNIKKIEGRIQQIDKIVKNKEYYKLSTTGLTKYGLEQNGLRRILEILVGNKTKGKIKRNFKRDGRQYKNESRNIQK